MWRERCILKNISTEKEKTKGQWPKISPQDTRVMSLVVRDLQKSIPGRVNITNIEIKMYRLYWKKLKFSMAQTVKERKQVLGLKDNWYFSYYLSQW